jgi:hypothetical protein
LTNDGQFAFWATFYLPSADNDDPREVRDPNDPRKVMRVLLVSGQQLERDVLPRATHCKVRYQIRGRLKQIDEDAMLSQLRRNDRPIKFYRSLAAALGGSGRLNGRNTIRVPGGMHLDLDAVQTDPGASATRVPEGIRTVGTPVQESRMAVIPTRPVKGVSSGYIYVRARVTKGTIGLFAGSSRTALTAAGAEWETHDPVREIFIPIQNFDDVDQLVIVNMQGGIASEVVLEDLAIVIAR